jgi:hypothetical protein
MSSAQRPDIHDPALHYSKMRIRSASRKKWCAGISGEHPVPLLDRDLFQRNRLKHPSIVYEKVEPSKLLNNLCDSFVNAQRIAKIAANRERVHTKSSKIANGLLRLLL